MKVGAHVIRKYQLKLTAKYWAHSNSTVLDARRSRHGKPWGAGGALFFSRSSSAWLTLGLSRGLSRNHHAKAIVQKTPRQPNAANASRQSIHLNRIAINRGVNAPPQRELIQ